MTSTLLTLPDRTGEATAAVLTRLGVRASWRVDCDGEIVRVDDSAGMAKTIPEALAVAFGDLSNRLTLDGLGWTLPIHTIEVRVGIGPLEGNVPLRILGHARCIENAVASIEKAIGSVARVVLFSSARKAFGLGGETPPPRVAASVPVALAALAGALRLAGLRHPIWLDDSAAERELPATIHSQVDLSDRLRKFFERAFQNNANRADPVDYAVEHAAPTMFADFLEPGEGDRLLRITVGARPEARFWAARIHVCQFGRLAGLPVVPRMAVLMRTLARPWYSPTSTEPSLLDVLSQPSAPLRSSLEQAANPTRGGNAGLKREVRLTAPLLDLTATRELAESLSTSRGVIAALRSGDYSLGARLNATLREAE